MPSREPASTRSRRIAALAAVPALRGIDGEALAALADQIVETPVRAAVPLPRAPGALRILPAGADSSSFGRGATFAASAPELLPWLARSRSWSRAVVPTASGCAYKVGVRALRSLLRNDFSVTLGVTRALARELVSADHALGFAMPAAPMPRAVAGDELLGLADRVLVLHAALPFARKHAGSLLQLARHAVDVRVTDGTELWRCGEAADKAVLVIRGEIADQAAGGERFAAGAGAFVGLIDALLEQPRSSCAMARGRLVALGLPMERWLDVLEDEPPLAEAFLGEIARQLLTAFRASR